jgi:DNA-directed RNA polymerase sigma subunit (sigma70/sigma32)
MDHIRNTSPVPRSQLDKLKDRYASDLSAMEDPAAGITVFVSDQSAESSADRNLESRRESNAASALGALFPISLDGEVTGQENELYHDVIGSDSMAEVNGLSEMDLMALREVISLMTSEEAGMTATLSANENKVLEMFLHGYSQVEMARAMSLTESRVCQIQHHMMDKMKNFLDEDRMKADGLVRRAI